jgi:Skp family chaperone for outer membrane proteins
MDKALEDLNAAKAAQDKRREERKAQQKAQHEEARRAEKERLSQIEARKRELKEKILPKIRAIEKAVPEFEHDMWFLPFYKALEYEYSLMLTRNRNVVIRKKITNTSHQELLIEETDDIPLLEALTQDEIEKFEMLLAQNANERNLAK